MKTTTFDEIKISGDSFTITGKIVEKDIRGHSQQVTVNEIPDENHQWSRGLRLSNKAVFVERFKDSFAIENPQILKLAMAVVPKLSWPPKFVKQPANIRIEANAEGSFSIETTSETMTAYQWMNSEDGKNWNALNGETSKTIKVKSSGWYRCMATNESGVSHSNPVSLIINAPSPSKMAQ